MNEPVGFFPGIIFPGRKILKLVPEKKIKIAAPGAVFTEPRGSFKKNYPSSIFFSATNSSTEYCPSAVLSPI